MFRAGAAVGSRRRSGGGGTPSGSWGTSLSSASMYWLGHSLINFDTPQMTYGLVNDAGFTNNYVAKIGNGANLQFQYVDGEFGQVWPEDQEIDPVLWMPANPRDVIVMTEAIPVADQIADANSLGYALDFFELGAGANADVQFYLYQSWPYLNAERGQPADYVTWASDTNTQLAYWQEIATYVNANRPGGTQQMLIIPAAAALVEYYVQLGGAALGQLFIDPVDDSIHLNNLGNYFISLVDYASIYRRSPVGLTNALENRFETMYDPMPTLEQAETMQAIALDVVRPWFQAGGLG